MERSMKRYVVVSTNNNPDYMFYAPYIEKAWNSLGWDLVVMITPDVNPEDLKLTNPESLVFVLPNIFDLRRESLAQAGRLYAANYIEDKEAILMTSDMDLLPLTDYWNPHKDNITVYGHDLTDYTFYPMGYIAMQVKNWAAWMKLTGKTGQDIVRDAEEYKHLTRSDNWESWWNWDWTMVTDRLKKEARDIVFINRGRRLTGTYAYGRIDRGDSMKTPDNELMIDAHCENVNVQHPDKLNRFLQIFEARYGKL